MQQVVIPNHLDTQLYNTLRNLVEQLKRQEIPVGTERTARGLADGEMAIVDIKKKRYLYTRQGKRLIRIPFEDVDALREETLTSPTGSEQRTYSSRIYQED